MGKERGGCMDYISYMITLGLVAVCVNGILHTLEESIIPVVPATESHFRVPFLERYAYWKVVVGSAEKIDKTDPWIVDKRTRKIVLGSLEFAGSMRSEKY